MAFYPVHKEFQDILRHMPKGNFGLWFNKFIPLNNENACEPSDDKSDKNRNVDYYSEMYASMKRSNASADMLKQKHADMDDYCASFPSEKYERIVICATLTTPLITGIGESHPHEVSMVFDHNMGVPYIPASGIKGVVRFAHTLSIFLDENGKVKETYEDQEYLDETREDIPDIFGGEKTITEQEKEEKIILRGRVVFLDSYPVKIPDLHIDIMNPHYAPYYSEGKPPADHHNPTPIKFLTVAKGESFIFRAVAEKKEILPEKVGAAFIKALTEEGVGAKTAIGYGRFKISEDNEKNAEGKTSAVSTTAEAPPSSLSTSAPIEEVWESAYLSYNAGGGGVLTATNNVQGSKQKAELRGKEKILGIVPEQYHKKLFDKPKSIASARVTVRKVGTNYIIISISITKT